MTAVIFPVLVGLWPVTLLAQDVTPILNGVKNAFYGEYEVISDHPECSNADQIALRVPVKAQGFDFAVFDTTNDVGMTSRGEVFRGRQECFVVTRRGAQVVRTPVACSAEQGGTGAAMARLADAARSSVALEGHVGLCMSPMGTQITEISWTVRMSQAAGVYDVVGDTVETWPGATNVGGAGAGGSFADFSFRPDILTSFSGTFFGPPRYEFSSERNFNPLLGQLRDVDGIAIEAVCVPVPQQAPNADPIYMGFVVDIFMVDAVPPSCAGTDCPTIVFQDPFRLQSSAGSCGR